MDEPIAVKSLWQLPAAQRILRKQEPDGSWRYPGGHERIRTRENYNQIETYRNLGILVEQFGFSRKHPAIQNAADFLFSFQSPAGDFRGIYGNQYSPNYSAGIAELLTKAGYGSDARVEKLMRWLLSMRQNDGGWAIPLRTQQCRLDVISGGASTVEPDRSQPASWMVTGVVLRAFAAHPTYRKCSESGRAGELLLSSLFRKDRYPDRAAPDYWLRFSFPFWFTDLISALDSLSLLGFASDHPQISKGLQWFAQSQKKSGIWDLKILKGRNRDILAVWLAFATCRIFQRFYG